METLNLIIFFVGAFMIWRFFEAPSLKQHRQRTQTFDPKKEFGDQEKKEVTK